MRQYLNNISGVKDSQGMWYWQRGRGGDGRLRRPAGGHDEPWQMHE